MPRNPLNNVPFRTIRHLGSCSYRCSRIRAASSSSSYSWFRGWSPRTRRGPSTLTLRWVPLFFHAHALTHSTPMDNDHPKESQSGPELVSQSVRVPGRPSCSSCCWRLALSQPLSLPLPPSLSHGRAVAQPKSSQDSKVEGSPMSVAQRRPPSSGDIPMPAWAGPTQVVIIPGMNRSTPIYTTVVPNTK